MDIDIGVQCSFTECKQLDFLPIKCYKCLLLFCRFHSTDYQHNCTFIEKQKETVTCKDLVKGYSCTVEKCKKRELTAIFCHDCNKQFCLKHRLPNDHVCDKVQGKVVTDKFTPHEKVVQIAGRVLTKEKPKGIFGKKSIKTSSKVIEIKLKMKSIGNQNIPPTERVYFNVVYNDQFKPLFFSQEHTIGKIIDQTALQFGVKNENHLVRSRKLRLFSEDEKELPLDLKLGTILESYNVVPFGNLVFRYTS